MSREAKYREAMPIEFRRNASWLNSVRLGLTASIWFAPTTFLRAVHRPIFAFLGGAVMTVLCALAWAFTRVWILGVGLAGYASRPENEERR